MCDFGVLQVAACNNFQQFQTLVRQDLVDPNNTVTCPNIQCVLLPNFAEYDLCPSFYIPTANFTVFTIFCRKQEETILRVNNVSVDRWLISNPTQCRLFVMGNFQVSIHWVKRYSVLSLHIFVIIVFNFLIVELECPDHMAILRMVHFILGACILAVSIGALAFLLFLLLRTFFMKFSLKIVPGWVRSPHPNFLLAQNKDLVLIDTMSDNLSVFFDKFVNNGHQFGVSLHHALHMHGFELSILMIQFLQFLLSFFVFLLGMHVFLGLLVNVNVLLDGRSLLIVFNPQSFDLLLDEPLQCTLQFFFAARIVEIDLVQFGQMWRYWWKPNIFFTMMLMQLKSLLIVIWLLLVGVHAGETVRSSLINLLFRRHHGCLLFNVISKYCDLANYSCFAIVNYDVYYYQFSYQNNFITRQMSRTANSRARSQSRGVCDRSRPGFQTKFKLRGGGPVIKDDQVDSNLNQSFQTGSAYHHNKGSSKRRSNSFLFANSKQAFDASFEPTSCKLTGESFKHHNPEFCVCGSCTCGRHLCQLHKIVKPDMTKTSIYGQDFYKKKPVENKINISKQYKRLQGPNLSHNSIYLKDFHGREGDKISRPIPEDLLKTGGPCNKLSSYTSQFPGYRGVNQYVKPTDKHTRADFPLRSKSTYSKSFLGEPAKKDDYKYFPDSLKTGSNWYGVTTYAKTFQEFSPEDCAQRVKIVEKIDEKVDDKNQYNSTYRNSFIPKESTVCKAKVQLEAKLKDTFSKTKDRFNENSDFKALSQDFHAISTSKHWYV